MKIKVKPEGREDIWIPERGDIKEFIISKDFREIHNFVHGGMGVVIGAHHSVQSVLEDIDVAERLAILTGDVQKQNFKHALSLIIDNKLEMYDIGEITVDDLEVIK